MVITHIQMVLERLIALFNRPEFASGISADIIFAMDCGETGYYSAPNFNQSKSTPVKS
jgi:hypothetical protein